MRRNFFTGFLIAFIPAALATAVVGSAINKEMNGEIGFRRGVDLAGGTILVYEVDRDRTLARSRTDADAESGEGLSSDQLNKLAENLKRRIDPVDQKNVIVRAVGNNRVEIILPFAGSTGGSKEGANEDYVREVRSLVSQTGVLEFRILANTFDDEPAIRDAQALLQTADNDPRFKAQLDNLAKAGLPPPAPDGDYVVTINNVEQDNVIYEWVELGKEERASLGLQNPKEGEQASSLWTQLSESRDEPIEYNVGSSTVLLYSRDFVKTLQTPDEEGKGVEYFVLTRVSPTDSLRIDGNVTLRASVDTDPRTFNPAVGFRFNPAGAVRFGRITERNRPGDNDMRRNLAVVMDGKVISAPSLNAVIRDSGQITSDSFDLPTVNRMVYILRSGALNADLKPEPVSENTVGATLGADTVRKGITSVTLAFAAVLVFMIIYYKFAGVVASIALLLNLLMTIGFMVTFNAAFTLPGLAGLVLMLGMAVDANVLIYERIREEREKGGNMVSSIRLGYSRSVPTILDTHLTSIFTAVVLYAFGNDSLKGFAVSLTLGLIISLFNSLYVTRLFFDYWVHRRWLTNYKPFKLFSRPSINFMSIRTPVFVTTIVITLLGFSLFLARGEAGLNVDFTRGTAYGGRLKEERALGRAVDGKPGMLELVGEARQREKLDVQDVIWLSKPDSLFDDASEEEAAEASSRGLKYIYKISYADGSEAIVNFVNAPDGDTEEAQLEDVKRRASVLPGYSVEQVRLSGVDDDLPTGTSKSFTIRTTEKEPDLVQVTLDRLLRDDESGKPLLSTTSVTVAEIKGPVATLEFDNPTSTRYFREFLLRELRLMNRIPQSGVDVEVEGISADDEEAAADEERTGKFSKMQVSVAENAEFKSLVDATEAKRDLNEDARAKEAFEDFSTIVNNAIVAFEARPLPDRLETFDPTLAADTRNRAMLVIMLSWLAIMAYLWLRFGSWTFGLAAVVCLIHDLCITLGAIAVCHYLHDTFFGQLLLLQDFKIDLPAVAALLTLVGFSVNDTIVVFDRIREVRGKNPLLTPQMINDSINQTLSRTVLSSLTLLLVVVVLYFFGGAGVHLFAFVMVVGVLVGTYSSIYVASPLLLLFGEGAPKQSSRASSLKAAAAS